MPPQATENEGDRLSSARGRALSSPLRLRILRFCLHEPRTNRQLAAEFGMNPGTMLHHVRLLERLGFLRAEDARAGTRGAREIPYRATGLSWSTGTPAHGQLVVDTFLQEIEGLASEDLFTMRLGLKLNETSRSELLHRLGDILVEFKDRPSDPDGRPISLLVAEHPDLPRAERAPGARAGTRTAGFASAGSETTGYETAGAETTRGRSAETGAAPGGDASADETDAARNDTPAPTP